MPFDLTVGVNSSSTPNGFHSVVAVPLLSVGLDRELAADEELGRLTGDRGEGRLGKEPDRAAFARAHAAATVRSKLLVLMPSGAAVGRVRPASVLKPIVALPTLIEPERLMPSSLSGIAAHFGDRDLEHDLLGPMTWIRLLATRSSPPENWAAIDSATALSSPDCTVPVEEASGAVDAPSESVSTWMLEPGRMRAQGRFQRRGDRGRLSPTVTSITAIALPVASRKKMLVLPAVMPWMMARRLVRMIVPATLGCETITSLASAGRSTIIDLLRPRSMRCVAP